MSMKRFSISGNAGAATITAAQNGLIKLETTAATRASLYEFDVASAAGTAPVDQNYQVALRRFSGGAGTWTTATPVPLDAADAAAVCIGGVAKTVDITTPGSTLFTIGFNARAGFRWVAIPDSEFVAAATVSAGLELKYTAVSGGTEVNACTFLYQE